VFDATFAKDTERKAFIEFAREHGAQKVQGVFAAVSYEIANERNQARERIVPEHAMERMHGMLKENPPIVEDGFDSVFDINELQELERAEMRIENEVITREFKQKLH
jgi:predicted kinase